jgi:hypothetical protein
VLINSWADYERRFGGLEVDSMMSYAVRDFYLNSGSQAIIIRIHNAATPSQISLPTVAPSPNDKLILEAASVGSWGKKLRGSVNYNTKDAKAISPDTSLFNLTVFEEKEGGALEQFLNVSAKPTDPRYLPRVLEQSSLLVRVRKNDSGVVPNVRPKETLVILSPPSGPHVSPPKMVDAPIASTGGTDGNALTAAQYAGSENDKTGIFALEKADIFNLLCIPPATRGGNTDASVYQKAMAYCEKRRAMLIVDPQSDWGALPPTAVDNARNGFDTLGLSGPAARNVAFYFPCVKQTDPLRDNQIDTFVPCGIVAGIMARTDTSRGVWKAPAGLEAALIGIQGLQTNLTDLENGQLNQLGINCLRSFRVNGRVVWGARTARGADQLADEYKYIPVRRLALFLEESLYRGTQWVVFEPNDEPLWAQIRLNIGAFMHNLFRQGAFQGKTPREAYLVKCDSETTTQNDINLGIVNILVGFAPLKPAEFVVIKIQQLAGQVQA